MLNAGHDEKTTTNLLDSVNYQNAGPKMNFLSVFTHAVMDDLRRQSILQINSFGPKSIAYN